MGLWRTHYLIPERSFASAAQTEVFDLPLVGVLSDIMLEIYAQSGNINADIFLADILTKIEVIGDGSTVIKSFTGKECQALAAYNDGRMPPDKELSPSGGCWGYFPIYFGRYPGDQMYALNCGNWNSLQLRLTYALTAGGTINTSGFMSTGAKITAWGHYAPVAAGFAPKGYIKSEEKHVWTTAATTNYDFDLARDYPYRRLMLVDNTLNSHVRHAFNKVTVNVNQGATKPIDRLDGDDLVHEMGLQFGMFQHTKRYYQALCNAATTFYTPIRWKVNVNPVGSGAYGAAYCGTLDPKNITVQGTGGAEPGWVQITSYGYCPHGCVIFDLEKLSGGLTGPAAMLTAWNARHTDDIDLEIYAYYANYSCAYVLEQYV